MLRKAAILIGLAACGPSTSAGVDAADDDVSCVAGESRCAGLDYQICTDGRFTTEQTCVDPQTCSGSLGCRAPVNECKVNEDGEGLPTCDDRAPAGSFTPDVQWSWSPTDGNILSLVTPLVGNFTDDNNDGEIDLCDTPDILLVAGAVVGQGNPATIYVLSGEDGMLHYEMQSQVDLSNTPAFGDIDGDGLPEVVSATPDQRIVVFEHTGEVKWVSEYTLPNLYIHAFALGDVDNDGDVEISVANHLIDHNGALLWTAPEEAGAWGATALADLDGDFDLEIVLGSAAYHFSGSPYYVNSEIQAGFPQIADFDGDGDPEVLITNRQGISMVDHLGTTIFQDLRPTGAQGFGNAWIRPATVHDFEGDGAADFAMSSSTHYAVYEGDGSIKWQTEVQDLSGIAAGTAFDFLGDGTAEAMYADETTMYVFGEDGESLMSVPRESRTLSEYPVVADVDNDGSAEIVVVSNEYPVGSTATPTVQVIRDVEDRWIQARRIWNQHTYHVTNVKEDGTIPSHEPHHWERLNTFRTNAQIQGGGVCEPTID